MFLLRIILFPLAVLYDGITRFRNLLYDLRIKPSASFDIPLISVGNLAVGGTGKTPMVEHIIRLLASHQMPAATLSRGYGRKTKGMRLANAFDSAETIGDEPYQLYKKYQQHTVVSVAEERVYAIPFLVDQFPDLKAIVMDDAFQHRTVIPGLSMVLTTYREPFYNDLLMPAGRLREARKGASRAHMVIVTKCPPNCSEEEMMEMEHAIRRYANLPVFFTTIRYGEVTGVAREQPLTSSTVVLVTGLANADAIKEHVESKFELLHHFDFKDHHTYTQQEWKAILAKAKEHHAMIVTTEKDKSKLEALATAEELAMVYYLPIEIEFIKGGTDFDSMVLDYVTSTETSL